MNLNFESSQAFVESFTLKPYQSGSLDGLSFAVKDNIDLAGYKTSYGSKAWAAAHPVAVSNALVVDQLLWAGATCLGKTITDEFTYSLRGENHYYGTPLNPKAPNRIPGGSSNGSASAVACGLVDFALGTDCAGSVRVPASFCGVWGMRPTTHRVTDAGVLPFAPSISTVGVFAKQLGVLEKVMRVLLRNRTVETPALKNIYLLEDAFQLADEKVRVAVEATLDHFKKDKDVRVLRLSLSEIIEEPIDLLTANQSFFQWQDLEVWNALGTWIENHSSELGPITRRDLEQTKQGDRAHINVALDLCEKLFHKISLFTKPGDLFCFPTAPTLPPLRGELADNAKEADFYSRTLAVTCFAGIGRLPEISVPVAVEGQVPVGLSLAAGFGQDEFLLAAVGSLFLG